MSNNIQTGNTMLGEALLEHINSSADRPVPKNKSLPAINNFINPMIEDKNDKSLFSGLVSVTDSYGSAKDRFSHTMGEYARNNGSK